MKILKSLSIVLAVALTGCASRRDQTTTVVTTTQPSVVYTAPTTYTNPTYTTHVTRTPLSTGRKVRVTALSTDISQNLDLNAVAALFAQSATMEAFEQALNREDGICNLDLNGDGYVDYIRVVEVEDNGTHLAVLQAVLAQDIYQDIATIVVEKPAVQTTTINCVQIVGDPFIYGRKYILEPVFVRRPVIFDIFWPVRPIAVYKPYRSPYVWGHMPAYYKPLPPRPMPTYVQQINVFVNNNNYCRHSNYVDDVRYSNYGRMQGTVGRNDYGQSNPDKSFEQRTTAAGVTATNARSINESNRVIIDRTMKNTDNVRFSGGTSRVATSGERQQTAQPANSGSTTTTGGRQSTTTTTSGSTTSGGRQTTTTSSSTTSGSRQQGTTTSGSTTSGGRQTTTTSSSTTSGSRQQGTSTSGSTTSGGRQTTTTSGSTTSGSRQQGTTTSGSTTSGSRQQGTTTSGSTTSGGRQTTTTSSSTTSGSRQQGTTTSGSATSGGRQTTTTSGSATSGSRTSSSTSGGRQSTSSATTSGGRTSASSSSREQSTSGSRQSTTTTSTNSRSGSTGRR